MPKRNITRVRVELKNKHSDPMKNFKDMLQEFRGQVSKAGVLHDFKNHEVFEGKSDKLRKKKREAIKKKDQDVLKEKILSGQRVKVPSGVIKKILSSGKKKKT